MYWFRHLQLRWKLLIMVMPLVLVPLLLVAVLISNIAIEMAYEGIARASRDDLKHMSDFSLDLIDDHYRQYEAYQKKKEANLRKQLGEMVNLAYRLVDTHRQHFVSERLPLENVMQAAQNGLKQVSFGEDGYISVMNSRGSLLVHPLAENQRIYNKQDESGQFFIREMCRRAVKASPGETMYASYSLANDGLADEGGRQKLVAYLYFSEWDWIITAETSRKELTGQAPVTSETFTNLKKRLKGKKVGETGFIYAADCEGTLVIHPHLEGRPLQSWLGEQTMGNFWETCQNRNSRWLSWQQQVPGDYAPRAKIARLEYFHPWNWVIFVEAYEDELFGTAAFTKRIILGSVIFLSFLASAIAGMLTLYVAGRFTYPIYKMTEEIARAKGTRMVRKISVPEAEELKKLAIAFNTMSELIQREKALEEKLARMEKMASIGVLSSSVAHEINNPMGVILGYACHLESKMDKDDANFHFVQEIKEESRRCVKIVQNLLDYAKAPNLRCRSVDINFLLEQIIDFAAGHADLDRITVARNFADSLPPVEVDHDQFRQVIMNLILNAAAAMPNGGEMQISTEYVDGGVKITIKDTGQGISPVHLKEVYEPFFTTKDKGTGLGLAISKQIVEAHMGSLEINSHEGVGTKVTIILPLSPAG
ncbi:MAG: cache domain-containing protein [Desulfocapsaceae bacterium]|nr:cache domain-containing protein [Desulfocapsaceae bacterium]